MNNETLNLNSLTEDRDINELLNEIEELELELLEKEKMKKEYGFVYSTGGGSRPRVTSTF